jgi:hypothetical protein
MLRRGKRSVSGISEKLPKALADPFRQAYSNHQNPLMLTGLKGVASLRNRFSYLLALTILVVAPLLGVGGRAQVGYVSLASLANPSPGIFSATELGQANPDELGAATASSDADINRPDDGKNLQTILFALSPTSLDASASSTGAGNQIPPNNSGPGGASQYPAATPRPPVDAPALVGILFLQTVSCMPPPFPSRTFRPPRWF